MAIFDFFKNLNLNKTGDSNIQLPKVDPVQFPQVDIPTLPEVDIPKLPTINDQVKESSDIAFEAKKTEPIPADTLEAPVSDVNVVQESIENAVTPSLSGFISSDRQTLQPEITPDVPVVPDKTEPTTREQIEQGMLALLGQDNTDEKAQLRKDAQVQEKQNTANRVLNELRSIRANFEDRKGKLENTNEAGRSMGAIRNDINKLTSDTNRNLAFKSIEYDIANNDFQSAQATVTARIQDMKDEEDRQVQMYQTLYNFVQNDMSDSEKVQAQQAFQEAQSERSFARQKELAKYNSLLRIDEEAISAKLKNAVTAQEAQEASKLAVPILRDKAGQIDGLLTDSGKKGAVGTNKLARISSLELFTGKKANFVAGVEQLISKETLDTLIGVKKRGGTFGALSEKELALLAQTASKIASWRVYKDDDPTKQVVAYKTTEKLFDQELKKLKSLTNRTIEQAGGSLDNDPLGLGVGGESDPLNLGI